MSQGGFLSMRAALRAPDRVLGLGLIDTQSGPEPAEALPVYEAMNDDWGPTAPSDELAGGGREHHHEPGLRPLVVDREVAGPPEGVHARAVPDARRTATTSPIGCPRSPRPRSCSTVRPTSRSRWRRAEQLLKELPNCEELVRIPGAGHASNLSHPAEVNGPLLAFLHKHSTLNTTHGSAPVIRS